MWLRKRIDPSSLGFESTAELEPLTGVLAQQRALEALRLGSQLQAAGYNTFVLGLEGADRINVVRKALEQAGPRCRPVGDLCYAMSFRDAEAPRLLRLPRGQARQFQRDIDDLVQSSFEILWNKCSRINDGKEIPFLFGIAA